MNLSARIVDPFAQKWWRTNFKEENVVDVSLFAETLAVHFADHCEATDVYRVVDHMICEDYTGYGGVSSVSVEDINLYLSRFGPFPVSVPHCVANFIAKPSGPQGARHLVSWFHGPISKSICRNRLLNKHNPRPGVLVRLTTRPRGKHIQHLNKLAWLFLVVSRREDEKLKHIPIFRVMADESDRESGVNGASLWRFECEGEVFQSLAGLLAVKRQKFRCKKVPSPLWRLVQRHEKTLSKLQQQERKAGQGAAGKSSDPDPKKQIPSPLEVEPVKTQQSNKSRVSVPYRYRLLRPPIMRYVDPQFGDEHSVSWVVPFRNFLKPSEGKQ